MSAAESLTPDRPTAVESDLHSVSATLGPFARLARLWRFRELLVGLVRTELKVKYKNSVLGFMWSLLNPALYLVVFWIVFTYFLPNGIPQFAIYLMSGLLVWNLFSLGLGNATGSIVANSGIVKKVAFPREILPVASVGAGLVHFFLQSIVLLAALILFQHNVAWGYMWLLVPALVALLILAAALGIFLTAVNVYLRDTQHFLELLLLAWFWMTPIVYRFRQVVDNPKIPQFFVTLYKLNPVLWIVLPFQRAIYNRMYFDQPGQRVWMLPAPVDQWWYLARILVVLAVAIVLLIGALTFFARVEGNFAEEL
ncbi:MAG: ABC transporter permease [Acidimicrobiia bacterium]